MLYNNTILLPRIRVINIVSESSDGRRRGHAREGWITYGTRVRRSGAETALQQEVQPEVNNAVLRNSTKSPKASLPIQLLLSVQSLPHW